MDDTRYSNFRWFVLVAFVIITTATSFSMIAPAPLLDEISKNMNVDMGVATASAMFTFNLFMALMALAGGFFLDKFGIVRMWLISLVVLALGSLLMPVIGNSIPGLVFCRFLHAAGTGPIMASVAAVSAQWFKPKEQTYVAALQGFSVCTGIALGLSFVPRILEPAGGWTLTVAWTSVLPAIAFVFGLVVLFGPKPETASGAMPKTAEVNLSSGDFRKALLGSTIFVLAFMGFFDSWCQQNYLNAMMPGFYGADTPLGLGMGAMGSTKLALASYFMMAGTLAAPVLTENFFRGNPKPTVFIGLTVAAVFIMTFKMMTPESGALLLVGAPCVVMFFSSFVNPAVVGYASKHYPSSITGRLGGLLIFFFTIGATAGQGISSVLLSKTESYTPPMLLMAIVTFAGALLVFALRPPKGFEQVDMEK